MPAHITHAFTNPAAAAHIQTKRPIHGKRLHRPEYHTAPLGVRLLPINFPPNNNDPSEKNANRKPLIKACFMLMFLFNKQSLVFLAVLWGQPKGEVEGEKKRDSPAGIDSVSPR